jgi:5-methylcytosine-specific restriction endonuclease McrA
MKEKILKLREQGKTYKEICEVLGCSKGTVSYYCGKGQKEKAQIRQQKRRADTVIERRVERFQYDRRIKDKAEDFQRERILKNGKSKLGKRSLSFTWRDVIEKFGWKTECYLTGREIDIREPLTYQFDHIVPIAKGGSGELNNLGICIRNANQAKHDMSVDELLVLCEEILEHHRR